MLWEEGAKSEEKGVSVCVWGGEGVSEGNVKEEKKKGGNERRGGWNETEKVTGGEVSAHGPCRHTPSRCYRQAPPSTDRTFSTAPLYPLGSGQSHINTDTTSRALLHMTG